eukprot:g1508.t1
MGGAKASSREALLSKKIRTQASQLAQLNESLQREGSYSRLLERRLLQLDPEHPLPVTPQHLDRGGGGSSRLQKDQTASATGGGLGRGDDHEDGDDMNSIRRGYAAAQERLKDAAQLIRTLREALASRDEDANAAVDRARTFQREASDLRRKLETITATSSSAFIKHSRAPAAASAIGRHDEKTVRFSDEAMGTGGERRGSSDKGSADQQQQQKERQELEKEVGRLRRELQEQRDACAMAEAEGDELQATVEKLERNSRGQGGDCSCRRGAESASAANATEPAREPTPARSTAASRRGEVAGNRSQNRRVSSGSRVIVSGLKKTTTPRGGSCCSSSTSSSSSSSCGTRGGSRNVSVCSAAHGESSSAREEREGGGLRPATSACRRDGEGGARVGSKNRGRGRGGSKSNDKEGIEEMGGELEDEKEALLDYVEDLLERIKGLEAACACLERERGESSILAEDLRKDKDELKNDLKAAGVAAEGLREEAQHKERQLAQAQAELERRQQSAEADRAEKEEMGRLYNELLEQLRAAEEEKEELRFQARQTAKREEAEGHEANALREQLDQSLRRLQDVQANAADTTRHAEEEALALKEAISNANSRLAKVESLEADVASRAKEIQNCRDEALGLQNALSRANSRLARLDALEADARARTKELEELREEGRERDGSLAKERDRTQHLVGALRDMEAETALLRNREEELRHLEPKVSELTCMCEELQKRVVSLQSGEDAKASQRQAAEAFALAEKQDQLLEDAAVRLEELRTQARQHQEDLRRFRESSETARNVLGPVLNRARSQLGLGLEAGAGGLRFASTVCPPRCADIPPPPPQQQQQQPQGSRSQMPSHHFRNGESEVRQESLGVGGDKRSGGAGSWQPGVLGGGDEGEPQAGAGVEVEDLAREAAEVLLRLLSKGGLGLGKGWGGDGGGSLNRPTAGGRWATPATIREERHAPASPLRRGFPSSHGAPCPASVTEEEDTEGPLRASNLTAPSPGWGEGGQEEQGTGRGDHHRPPCRRQPLSGCGTGNLAASQGRGCHVTAHCGRATAAAAAAVGGSMTTDEEEEEEAMGQTRGTAKPPAPHLCSRRHYDTDDDQSLAAGGTATFGHHGCSVMATGGDRGGERGSGIRGRGRPAVAITVLDRDTLRRMEAIRRGGHDTVLADGVKSGRRGHLEGGRSPTSIKENWMTRALLEDSLARSPATRKRHDINKNNGNDDNGTIYGAANNNHNNASCSASHGGNLRGSRRWGINGGGLPGESFRRKTTTKMAMAVGPRSPDARKIRKRIHEARAALRALRSTT